MRRRGLAARLAALAALATALCLAPGTPAAAAAPAPAPIHHVFIIVLENQSASVTFGPDSPAPYLAKTLRSEGVFIPKYYGIGHESNDNYIAMISGQAPNPDTQADCEIFSNFEPGTISSDGQALGTGCVFPSTVKTVADQLDAAGLTWRDYNQSMGANPSRESSVCGHPPVDRQDNTQSATAADEYAARHNPFVYFHSIIDDTTLCDTNVVNLDVLAQDLKSASSTPNYVFISPDLCSDGHDANCADKSRPGGFAGINRFLQQWVPMITGSPAFKQEAGLLAIIFDEGATSDTGSCCGEIPGPNSPDPGVEGSGGGDTGAVLLSPCIKPGTVSAQAYNHYTLLRSVEDIFGLPHLGYAQLAGERSLGSDVFNQPCTAPAPNTCPQASGRLSGRSLGPLALGMTRAAAHRRLGHVSLIGYGFEDFCLAGGPGIRAGFPSAKLLRTVPARRRRRLAGRIVMALSANRRYALSGVRPGAHVSAVAHRLRLGRPFHIGRNYWYIAPGRTSNGVLKVRGGVIEEVGIATRSLTASRRAQARFLHSFT